jgi:DNA-binding MarR family transcriptional regulator
MVVPKAQPPGTLEPKPHRPGTPRDRTFEVAAALHLSVGQLRRRLRQVTREGEITFPEAAALAKLDRGGPGTSAELARSEQISPQSMGATLAGLEARGFLKRSSDPADARRVVMSLTESGLQMLNSRRNERVEELAHALSTRFTSEEIEKLRVAAALLDRLAQSIVPPSV